MDEINPNLGADTSHHPESDLNTEDLFDTTSEDGSDAGDFNEEEDIIEKKVKKKGPQD